MHRIDLCIMKDTKGAVNRETIIVLVTVAIPQ